MARARAPSHIPQRLASDTKASPPRVATDGSCSNWELKRGNSRCSQKALAKSLMNESDASGIRSKIATKSSFSQDALLTFNNILMEKLHRYSIEEKNSDAYAPL